MAVGSYNPPRGAIVWKKPPLKTEELAPREPKDLGIVFPLLPFAIILSGFLCSLIALVDLRSDIVEHLAVRAEQFVESRSTDEWLTKIASEILDDESAYLNVVSTKLKREPAPSGELVRVPHITTKKNSQALVSQVLRIINNSNKRQTAARRLAVSIVGEALRQGYDPLFVAAVIKSESAFNELAVSHKGAQGLMQIMPATGQYLAKSEDPLYPRKVSLTDPGTNLRLGVKYLRELESTYSGNRLLTLIAYNWGPGKLDRAIRSGRGVPRECYEYALKILKDHHVWNQV